MKTFQNKKAPFALGLTFAAALLICLAAPIHAAITWSGDLDPTDPTTWSSSIFTYVGKNSTGTITVDGASTLRSTISHLGYNPGSSGTVTVTGINSSWQNENTLYIGYGGIGILNIEAGGLVSNTDGILGSATGIATVTGTGSKWINSGSLQVGGDGRGTLTVDNGGSVVVGQSIFASLNDLKGNGTISANGGILDADFIFDVAHGLQNSLTFGSGGTITITPSAINALGVGYTGYGTLRIAEGETVASFWGCLGRYSGACGSATVTGIGSNWNTSSYLYVGYDGNGTLNIEAGGQVSNTNFHGYLGYNAGSSGLATVSDIDSKWTNSGDLYIGYKGTGTLNIEAGGQVSNSSGYIGYNSGSTGTVTVTGAGSTWTNNGDLYVGKNGNGTLTVKDSGLVSVSKSIYASSDSLLGNGKIFAGGGLVDVDLFFDASHGSQGSAIFGSSGTLTITPSESNPLGVGYLGKGTLSISGGVNIASLSASLGYSSGSSGSATVEGTGSRWTIKSVFYVGKEGAGILTIEDGGLVSNGSEGYIGDNSGSSGTVTVIGSNSKWTFNSYLYIGKSGTGKLNIEKGGVVSNISSGTLGNSSGSSGTVTVTGVGSKWNNYGKLYVGSLGTGTMNIEDGGQVTSNFNSYLAYNSGSQGTVSVKGTGSTWTNTGDLNVGFADVGALNIESGGQVSDINGYLGYNSSSSGTISVTGAGSKWKNQTNLYIGYSGNGLLNIGSRIASEGAVFASSVILANNSSANATCNLDGGTIQMASLTKGSGAASFNWSDGTIRNLSNSIDLAVNGTNNLSLRLTTTGTHAFYIDAGRKGTVSAVLSDATSGGTLAKQGAGLLTLSSENTYTGSTTITAGTLALSSTGSLASSPIDVKSGATFDVSAKNGYVLAAGKTLTGAGTIVGDLSVSGIHAPGNSTGVETVKGNYSLLGELQIEFAGTGYDEVLIRGSSAYNAALSGMLSLDWTNFTGSADATQLWIVKNDTAGTLSGAFSNFTNGASLGLHDGRSWCLYYNADAATGNLTGGNDVLIAPVPEPAAIVLLVIATLAAIAWHRKSRVG